MGRQCRQPALEVTGQLQNQFGDTYNWKRTDHRDTEKMKFLTVLAVLGAMTRAEITKEEGVLVLTNDNFEGAIADNEFILVEFYAPWCGHCKALAPEYAKAAGLLAEKDSAVKLGKVDATEEPKLAEKFEVRGYPTLKFFKNGKPMEYGGGRTAETIISWVEKKTGPPAAALADAEAVKTFVEGKTVAVLGCFKDETTDAAKAFLAAASNIDDMPFGITGDCSEHGVEGEAVVVVKTFDDGKAVLTEGITEEEVAKFVSAESLPLVVDFNHETAQKIFSGEVKSHFLLFSSAKADDHEDKLTIMREQAKKNKGKMLFVTINTDEEDHKRILEFFGIVDSELPTFRAIRLSEEIPEDWDKEPVKVLVGKNFHDVAMDVNKDVLVEFYAPWCGHCKQLAPIWDKLGEKYADNENIVIAKMDSTANELEEVKVQGFPTIKLFKKGTNEIVDYNGDRTVEGFSKFLDEPAKEQPKDEL